MSDGPSALPSQSSLVMEEKVSIGHVRMGFSSLSIGAHSFIRSNSELSNVARIGRFCSIGNGVVLGQDKAAHPLDWVSSHPFQHGAPGGRYQSEITPAVIEEDVWIGRDAMILEGVRVGAGAVVATRALVTRDVPPYAIVAGVPARIIRYRHPPAIIASLLEARWWERSVEELLRLPMSDPKAFIDQLSETRAGRAVYQAVEVTRSHWKAVQQEEL